MRVVQIICCETLRAGGGVPMNTLRLPAVPLGPRIKEEYSFLECLGPCSVIPWLQFFQPRCHSKLIRCDRPDDPSGAQMNLIYFSA